MVCWVQAAVDRIDDEGPPEVSEGACFVGGSPPPPVVVVAATRVVVKSREPQLFSILSRCVSSADRSHAYISPYLAITTQLTDCDERLLIVVICTHAYIYICSVKVTSWRNTLGPMQRWKYYLVDASGP